MSATKQDPTGVLQYSTAEEIDSVTDDLRATFESGLTRSLKFRKQQLREMLRMFDENETELLDALYKDLHKSHVEGMVTELSLARQEITTALSKLNEWSKSEYPSTRFAFWLNEPHIRIEPRGIVMVMGAWNYPISLLLTPVVSAIAAGNTVVIKPSELSPNTAKVITDLVSRYLDQRAYRVLNGSVEECTQLLNIRFDYIFYTGGGAVGKIVMAAAAKHLTPVTLELGGKSPAIIHSSANIEVAARRIFFGKSLNAGQTCIAPDYVICPRDLVPRFVDAIKAAYAEFYNSDASTAEFGHIVNHRHFDRLVSIFDKTKEAGAQVVMGGKSDREQKYIEPTVLRNVSVDSPLLKEEIFGPYLPILELDSIDEAIAHINRGDQPLALYLFSTNKRVINQVLDSTRSGGAVINDCVVQYAIQDLPFGGCGHSGFGQYRGKYGFDTFSHKRATLNGGYGDELIKKKLLYPPFQVNRLPWVIWALTGRSINKVRAKLLSVAVLTTVFIVFLATKLPQLL